ncbi:MAG: potassium-transporting ATPase subunit C, partial [Thermodesulfobacteriota bacterium]
DAADSGGSNLGPLSKELHQTIADRVRRYRSGNGLSETTLVPADAVTASASGLDPHISPANAQLQAHRVVKARGMSEDSMKQLIEQHTEGRTFGIFGDPRINVLTLNLALDRKR